MSALRAAEWEKQRVESTPAFQAFATYRDLGPSRSLRVVARELGKSGSLISRWSTRHNWITRALAWDSAQDRRRQLVLLDAAEETARQHAELLRAHLVSVSIPALELTRRFAEGSADIRDLDNQALIALVCRAATPAARLIELERDVHGLADKSSEPCCEHERARREFAQLSDEELERLLVGR